MDQMKSSIIEIASIEKNDAKVISIKDTNNLKYGIWKTRVSDWAESVAYAKFKTLPDNGIWMKVKVATKEEEKEYLGRKYIQRTIVTLDANIPQESQTTAAPSNQQSRQQSFSQIQNRQDDNAEWKVRFWFAIEAYKLWMDLDVPTTNVINKWTKYVMTGKLSEPIIDKIADELWGSEVESWLEDSPF